MKKPIMFGMVAALVLLLLSSCSGSKGEVAPVGSTPPATVSSAPPATVGSTPLPDAVTTPSVGILVGNLAPGFQLNDMNGKTVSLSDFRGRPVLLNFWATW